MPKINGPLHSDSVQGKVGKSIVHFIWKGKTVGRSWRKPSNPMTAKQGLVRQELGGLGASVKPVQTDSLYQLDALSLVVGAQTYVSKYVQYMRNSYMALKANYESFYSEYAGHTAKTAFDSQAISAGLSTFVIPYAAETGKDFTAGMQLYCLAKYATIQHGMDAAVFNRAPYTTALASWTITQIEAMVADFVKP